MSPKKFLTKRSSHQNRKKRVLSVVFAINERKVTSPAEKRPKIRKRKSQTTWGDCILEICGGEHAMACNFLALRTPDLRGSDTLSEISESGTTNSGWTSGWDSREDLRDFVTKIGLKDVADLHQDRFRVDRKKLEQMLSGDNEAPLPADIFFEQVMSDTGTFITWPSKLKIGAKSKKDPHVRIAGRPENVQAAKERIMTILNTRCNRVTMKMDVSYTDHSHIIGKGGLSIKRVMEETQCHVHFPDSNRSNPTDKSNQVSIAGDIQGVELARSRVRQKTPVVFGFELPIMSQTIDLTCTYVLKVQEQYNVQVMLRTRPKLHATLVLVKGVEWEVDQVKKATVLLMEFMCDNLASQIPIQMSLEISPHHHPMVVGKNHANLKEIMRLTGAQIMFPDAQDPNIPSLKKSNVTITGNIHSVYAARQLLIGTLPLLLMFDLPEDTPGASTKSDFITELQNKFDISVTIRSKAKQSIMSCVIKGTEKLATNIYKARNIILGVDDPRITADIPSSYHVPAVPQNYQQVEVTLPQISTQQPMSPLLSPLISPTWHFAANAFSQSGPFVGMVQAPQFLYNSMQQSMSSSGYHSLGPLSSNSISLEQSRDNSTYSSISSASSLCSPISSPRNHSPNYHHHRTYAESSPDKADSSVSSVLSDLCDKHQERSCFSPSEFEQKRLAGFKAMQNRLSSGLRYPNNAWSGYGISNTSPSVMMATEKKQFNFNKDEDMWKTPTQKQHYSDSTSVAAMTSPSDLNTSNYMDHTPSYYMNRMTTMKWPDLTTLLTSLGLEKYIATFNTHEIDLTTFVSMTDNDLLEIGITAFGARRKIMLAIAEMKKRVNQFSAAPGAERKSSCSPAKSSNPLERW